MKVSIPCFVMQGGKSGISTYVLNLLSHLMLESDLTYEYFIYGLEREKHLFPKLNSSSHFFGKSNLFTPPFLNILWHQLALPWITCCKHFDLVHFPCYRRLSLSIPAKIVVTVHDLAPIYLREKYGELRHYYHKYILAKMLQKVDYIIAVSEFTKNELLKVTKGMEDKIKVIYSGIDTQLYKKKDKCEALYSLYEKYGIQEPFIVYVSRIEHPAKNHLRLIKAFEILKRKENFPYQLVFAGADWNDAKIVKDYVRSSSVKSSIYFLGFVKQEDIVNLYNGCELMVFPSLYEGFGFPVLEALACGADVICSRTSSLAEIAKDYIPTFDPFSIEEIIHAMKYSLSKKEGLPNRQKAMSYAQTYNWNKTALEVLKVYRQCM